MIENNYRILKTGLIFFLFLASLTAFSQFDTTFIRHDKLIDDTLVYTTDTLIVKQSAFGKPLLQGTTILPGTANLEGAQLRGFKLINVDVSSCRKGKEIDPYIKEDEVVNVNKSDSLLTIELRIYANCCHDFLCEIGVINDSTLSIIYTGYGNVYCSCKCAYNLSYYIVLNQEGNQQEEIDKVEYIAIDGDLKSRIKID
jgi:hypothetical protein